MVQIVSGNEIYLAFVQRPHVISNNLPGILKLLGSYVSRSKAKRSTLFPNSKERAAVLLTQLSDEGCFVAEIRYRNTKVFGISLTFLLRDAPTSLTFNNCTFCPHCIDVLCKQRRVPLTA
jgi:hypothetical protein